MIINRKILPVRALVIVALAALIGITILVVFYINLFIEGVDTSITPFLKKTGIVITSIDGSKAGGGFMSPITIKGYVNGDGWQGFEGQVGMVKLVGENNKVLGSAILSATTEWTNPKVNFEAELVFIDAGNDKATLIFKNENPSGIESKNKEFKVQVKIAAPSLPDSI